MISALFWDLTQRRLVTKQGVSGQPIGPIFKGQVSPPLVDYMALEDRTSGLPEP